MDKRVTNASAILEEITVWVNDYFKRFKMNREGISELELWNLKMQVFLSLKK